MDHKLLEANLSVQRAALRLACGDREGAFELANQALDEAEATKDTEAKLNALLLIVKLSDDQEHITQTGLIIDDLHLDREKELLMFSQLELLLEKGDADRARDLALTLKVVPLNKTEEIELAWMCNLVAESLLNDGDQDSAELYIRKGLGMARRCGLLPELMVGLMLQGRLHFTKEAWEECYSAYKKALQFCQKIAESLDNDKDRRYYQQQRTVQFLVKEIKRLGSLLSSSLQSKKKGQTM
jgi:tetratricopeptide (TPR) repeat protein